MMRRVLAGVAGALLLAACNQGDTGYVELKMVPASARPALYLDSEKVDPKGPVTVLRQRVGTARLLADPEGKVLLCQVVVRKNRITTLTVSPLERPPRCQCERTGGTESAASRTCIG